MMGRFSNPLETIVERLYSKSCICRFPRRQLSTLPEENQKNEPIRKTSLYDVHVANGGKMVGFSGFLLPTQYGNTSILASHLHTRNNCSIFDVSHMLQTNIYGKHAMEFIESVSAADTKAMKIGKSTLCLLLNEKTAGIIDDFILTKVSENFLYIVSNASRQQVDKKLFLDKLDHFKDTGKDVTIEFIDADEMSLIAIQGPKTASLIQSYVDDIELDNLNFMESALGTFCGVRDCRISRCGYTGEDGFEISIPSTQAPQIVENLLKIDYIKLAGLGTRDTLRIEAGLCLYGNDIDECITPVEAGLLWTISKEKRKTYDFPGGQVIKEQIQNGVSKKRVGLRSKNGGPVARQGTEIYGNDNNEVIGIVTSGCPSPTLGANIAMGYVSTDNSKLGTELKFKIRGGYYNTVVTKMPFIPSNYYIKK